MFISTALYSVGSFTGLVIIYILTLFWRTKKSNYWLVLFTVYLGIGRVFMIEHVALLQDPFNWAPSAEIKSLWMIYCIILFVFFTVNLWYMGKLWNNVGWFNRLIGCGLSLAILVCGFRTIYVPYWVILG